MFSRQVNRDQEIGISDGEGVEVPLDAAVDPAALDSGANGALEFRWNEDGSFERLREAASRSGDAPEPPARFHDLSELGAPAEQVYAEHPAIDLSADGVAAMPAGGGSGIPGVDVP